MGVEVTCLQCVGVQYVFVAQLAASNVYSLPIITDMNSILACGLYNTYSYK